MKSIALSALAALITIPGLASAQDFTGALTFSFGKTDVSNVSNNIYTTGIDGRIDTTLGSNVTAGLSFNGVQGRMSGVSGHLRGTLLGAYGSYKLANGLGFGAYVEQGKISASGSTTDITGTSYGLTTSYAVNNLTLGAFYGRTTTDPVLPAGVGIHSYGISGKYRDTSGWVLGGTLMRTRMSSATTGVDFDLVGIGGLYPINRDWVAFGGISHGDIGLLNANLTNYGLGVTYDLSRLTRFNSSIAVEYVHSHASVTGASGNLNSYRLSWTIPFGKATRAIPQNSVADSVLNPTHSVISSAVRSTF